MTRERQHRALARAAAVFGLALRVWEAEAQPEAARRSWKSGSGRMPRWRRRGAMAQAWCGVAQGDEAAVAARLRERGRSRQFCGCTH